MHGKKIQAENKRLHNKGQEGYRRVDKGRNRGEKGKGSYDEQAIRYHIDADRQ